MLNIFCLIVIASTALINIYAHWIEDGLLGRLLYMATFFTCGAGLIHVSNGNVPMFIWSTLLVLVTLIQSRSVCVKSIRYFRYWRLNHAKNGKR